MGSYTKPSARPQTENPERRLLAAVVLRAVRDLRLPDPYLRHRAVAFFDEEGIALAVTLGVPISRIRQVVAEAGRG